MKLSVIGATGPTGLSLVKQALDQGHEVKAIVRNPSKITTTHQNLQVIGADLTDSSQLVDHFRGCDAVLSAVGGKPGMYTPCDAYTLLGKSAITAMREVGVIRLICVTSWGTKDDPNLPFIWRRVLKPTILRNAVKNMEEFEDYLSAECDDINYTVVRPPRLLSNPSEGKEVNANEGLYVNNYKSTDICREDLAKFMLSCLCTEIYDKKMVAINTN